MHAAPAAPAQAVFNTAKLAVPAVARYYIRATSLASRSYMQTCVRCMHMTLFWLLPQCCTAAESYNTWIMCIKSCAPVNKAAHTIYTLARRHNPKRPSTPKANISNKTQLAPQYPNQLAIATGTTLQGIFLLCIYGTCRS